MSCLAGLSLVFFLLMLVGLGFSWGFVVGVRVADQPAPEWLRRLFVDGGRGGSQ